MLRRYHPGGDPGTMSLSPGWLYDSLVEAPDSTMVGLRLAIAALAVAAASGSRR